MKLKNTLLALPLLTIPVLSQAAMLDIKITNLTQGITFTPLLVTAHAEADYLFRVGMPASQDLKTMAESGNIDGLVTANSEKDPAGGMLAPTASAMVSGMDTGSQTHLSIVGMLLPTNDGFVGLDSWKIPTTAGTYHVYLNGYDAGTEANDELLSSSGGSGAGIPDSPADTDHSGGAGVTSTIPNDKVHIHPGNVGDSNPSGGISDVDSRIHRWLNPVAKVTVTVK